jgi:transposase-like protein
MEEQELHSLADADFAALESMVSRERMRRDKEAARFRKSGAARTAKRDPRCPSCGVVLSRDGKRRDGVQTYVCPKCGRKSCDASNTSLASSKLTLETIRETIGLIMADCPDWVASWIVGIDIKTVQFWRDRCLDASQEWAKASTLSGHVWIDEMRFAPTRSGGLVDGVWVTYGGRLAKDAYLEVAFDASGSGFCKLYAEKLGTPTRNMVLETLKGRIEPGSMLTHDGALSHNLAVRELGLGDDWCKFVPGDADYERKMKLMSNCCSYLRHGFESHPGIKFGKLEAYANFFMYRWSHVRKGGLKNAVSCMVSRVCGTPKSHVYAESFKKTSVWS